MSPAWHSPSWLLVPDTLISSSLREAGAGGLATNSVWILSSASSLLVVASIGVAGVCDPMVTGVVSMLVTCFLLVFHLLPVRALKMLVINP